PYKVRFNMRTVRVEPPSLIEGHADGELSGTGRWTLTSEGTGTRVRYDWIVEVTKPWMRLLAPLLRPVFAWNHNKVMEWGRAGLERKPADQPCRGPPTRSALAEGHAALGFAGGIGLDDRDHHLVRRGVEMLHHRIGDVLHQRLLLLGGAALYRVNVD